MQVNIASRFLDLLRLLSTAGRDESRIQIYVLPLQAKNFAAPHPCVSRHDVQQMGKILVGPLAHQRQQPCNLFGIKIETIPERS